MMVQTCRVPDMCHREGLPTDFLFSVHLRQEWVASDFRLPFVLLSSFQWIQWIQFNDESMRVSWSSSWDKGSFEDYIPFSVVALFTLTWPLHPSPHDMTIGTAVFESPTGTVEQDEKGLQKCGSRGTGGYSYRYSDCSSPECMGSRIKDTWEGVGEE